MGFSFLLRFFLVSVCGDKWFYQNLPWISIQKQIKGWNKTKRRIRISKVEIEVNVERKKSLPFIKSRYSSEKTKKIVTSTQYLANININDWSNFYEEVA